jgi:hypothetical protein
MLLVKKESSGGRYFMKLEVYVVVWMEAGRERFVPELAKEGSFYECFIEKSDAVRHKEKLETEAERLQADVPSTTWESRDVGAKGNYKVHRAILEII